MAGADLSTRRYGDQVVVVVRGELDLAGAAGAAATLAVLTVPDGEIIIDLAALQFIDCCGPAALADVCNHARRAREPAGGQALELAGPGGATPGSAYLSMQRRK